MSFLGKGYHFLYSSHINILYRARFKEINNETIQKDIINKEEGIERIEISFFFLNKKKKEKEMYF